MADVGKKNYPEEELVWVQFSHRKDDKKHVVRDTQPPHEYWGKHKNGDRFWIHEDVYDNLRRDAPGRVKRVKRTQADIDREKAIEEEKRKAQEELLRESAEAQEAFLRSRLVQADINKQKAEQAVQAAMTQNDDLQAMINDMVARKVQEVLGGKAEAVAQVDDLTVIDGLGQKSFDVLRQNGILTFADLAEADVETVQALLGGRVNAESVVAQATEYNDNV
jgi:predicted flap endonuclease-1-like 5' DNA nuclease